MAETIFLTHLKNCLDALNLLSNAAAIADHNGNKGTVREGLIANFLEKNLPEFVRYHSGEIFDCLGERSGQIDIVLHPITSPKLHLYGAINLFPTETVLAAIEVKSRFDTKTLKDVLEACNNVKKLSRFNQRVLQTTQGSIDVAKVPYILFSYKGLKEETLFKNMTAIMDKRAIPHENLPDLIVVLDKGYCLEKPASCADKPPLKDYYRKVSSEKDNVLLGLFVYLMKLIEDWSSNSSIYAMPIAHYKKVWKTQTGALDACYSLGV